MVGAQVPSPEILMESGSGVLPGQISTSAGDFNVQPSLRTLTRFSVSMEGKFRFCGFHRIARAVGAESAEATESIPAWLVTGGIRAEPVKGVTQTRILQKM